MLFNSYYPYKAGDGLSFVEPEVEVLSRYFNIILITTSSILEEGKFDFDNDVKRLNN